MRRPVVLAIALGALSAALVHGAGIGAEAAGYAGSGTVVAKESGQEPLLDDGAAVCLDSQALSASVDGLGGGCVSFPQPGRPGAVQVVDDDLGLEVAFQVCVDVNQDGHCYMRAPDPAAPSNPCDDIVGFSHDDKGNFFNPLGHYIEPGTGLIKPLPTSIPAECRPEPPEELPVKSPRRTWYGYVVFLCEGVHSGPNDRHLHTPTTGTITTVMGAQFGAGDFCQTIRDNFKEYYVLG